MPYGSNDELPDAVKRVLPSDKARSIWRRVFNASLERGYQEGRAFGAAYAAIESAGYKKDDAGVYVSKAETYVAPESAQNNARRALGWRAAHGDEVKGGTQVGWTRARQLADGEALSAETVGRMAQFNRHRQNSEVAPEYKGTPWRDAGHVAWLLWGGTAGVDWAIAQSERMRKESAKAIGKRQISDDVFTTAIEAVQRAQQLGLGLAAHVTEGPDGQVYYMPGESHEDYLELVSVAGMISEGEAGPQEIEDPTEDLIETVIEAAISAILEASVEKRSARIIKLDDEARIVWGWASVVSIDNVPLVDRQGDIISPEVMTKAADAFMTDVRTGKAMHEGGKIGEVIHSFPITKELGKALGVYSALEGWIVAMKVHDNEVWNRVKSGELSAFSIGGVGKRNAV